MQSDETTVRRVQRYELHERQYSSSLEVDPDGEWCRAEDVARLEEDYAQAVEVIRRAMLYVYNAPFEGAIPMSNAMQAVLAKAEGREGSDA